MPEGDTVVQRKKEKAMKLINFILGSDSWNHIIMGQIVRFIRISFKNYNFNKEIDLI